MSHAVDDHRDPFDVCNLMKQLTTMALVALDVKLFRQQNFDVWGAPGEDSMSESKAESFRHRLE